MTNDVILSAALRANLLSLQGTQDLIDRTQLRLSTGKRVNTALDNPQNFVQKDDSCIFLNIGHSPSERGIIFP